MNYQDKETIMESVAMLRSVYSFIDQKTNLLVDAESKYIDALEQEEELKNKYRGKFFVLWFILATVAFLIPMCMLSLIIQLNIYWITPVVAIIAVLVYRNNYEKKKLPVLLNANKDILEGTKRERDSLINVINRSYYNIKAELDPFLRSEDNEEFIEQLDCEGVPIECENLIALDYMYCAIQRNYAKTFADALLHFQKLKNDLKTQKDDKSISLYKEISDGELRAEYRSGVIKHCLMNEPACTVASRD